MRGTAYALLALVDLGEPKDSLLVNGAVKWLMSKLSRERQGESWEGQVWDTALGLMVYKKIKETTLTSVEKWLTLIRTLNTRRPTWHDEPYDTCFAAMALLEEPVSVRAWDPKTTDWLKEKIIATPSRQPGRPGGRLTEALFDNYHFTALYIRLICQMRSLISNHKLDSALSDYPLPIGCIQFLGEVLQSEEPGLWSGEVWCNSYCVLALAEAESLTPDQEKRCISWFLENRESDGGFGSVEDTSLATLAMHRLFLRRKERDLEDRLEKGGSREIVRLAARGDSPKRGTPQFRRDMVMGPPQFFSYLPDDSVLMFIPHAKRKAKALVAALGGIATLLVAIAAIFEILDLWPG